MDHAEFNRWDKPWKRNGPLTEKEKEHNERCARMCQARKKLEDWESNLRHQHSQEKHDEIAHMVRTFAREFVTTCNEAFVDTWDIAVFFVDLLDWSKRRGLINVKGKTYKPRTGKSEGAGHE
jgi:hypothetical protein